MQERHISEEELTAALAGDASENVRAHLAACANCRDELERLRGALGGFAEAAREEAGRPEYEWTRQRAAIAERIRRQTSATHRLAWAAGFAALLLAASFFIQQGWQVEQVEIDPDHLFLYEVQRSVWREVPAALEPATLLTQEMARAVQTQSDSARKNEGEKK
jgi:predicted anti-sigma-YlaC factor YlaD